jgi:hypothetical protein
MDTQTTSLWNSHLFISVAVALLLLSDFVCMLHTYCQPRSLQNKHSGAVSLQRLSKAFFVGIFSIDYFRESTGHEHQKKKVSSFFYFC